MDGIENIAYVAIAIGWFIWNTYRKMQSGKEDAVPAAPRKRRDSKPQPQQQPTTFKSLEDMILEQLEGKKMPELEVVPAAKHSNRDKFLSRDLKHSHLADDYKMSQDESKSHRVERQVRVLKDEMEDEESLMDMIAPNGFDLRTAVVMNAVLERPYS